MKRFMIILYATLSMFAFSANAGIADNLKGAIDARITANPHVSSVTVSFDGLQDSCVLTKDFDDGTESLTTACPVGGPGGLAYLQYLDTGKYKAKFDVAMLDTNYAFSLGGSNGQLIGNADLRIYVSEETKTTEYAIIECTNASGHKDCSGSLTITGVRSDFITQEETADQFAGSIETDVTNIAKSEAIKAVQAQTPVTLQTANENAQGYADAGRDAAIKHANDIKAAINKDVNGKLETLETSVNDSVKASDSAKSSADGANLAVANLTKTVKTNRVELAKAVLNGDSATLEDAKAYTDTTFGDLSNIDLAETLKRLEALEDKVLALEKTIELLKKLAPVILVNFDGTDCPNNRCRIINKSDNVKYVEQMKYHSTAYKIHFKSDLKNTNYIVNATSSWDSENQGLIAYERNNYPDASEPEPSRSTSYFIIRTTRPTNGTNKEASSVSVTLYNPQ